MDALKLRCGHALLALSAFLNHWTSAQTFRFMLAEGAAM
jgi:hypothetical protein